jgi:hypothetical protein
MTNTTDFVDHDGFADTFGYTPHALDLALRLARAREDEDQDAYRAVITEITNCCIGCMRQLINALIEYVDPDDMQRVMTEIELADRTKGFSTS